MNKLTEEKILKIVQEAVEAEQKKFLEILHEYKCDFNWDFKKDKPKHN